MLREKHVWCDDRLQYEYERRDQEEMVTEVSAVSYKATGWRSNLGAARTQPILVKLAANGIHLPESNRHYSTSTSSAGKSCKVQPGINWCQELTIQFTENRDQYGN
jgi:hypothetical protein